MKKKEGSTSRNAVSWVVCARTLPRSLEEEEDQKKESSSFIYFFCILEV